MTVGLLVEKPSAAKHFAAALGGSSGTYNGENYVIAAARGHLYEFVDPSKMVDPSLADKYAKWDLGNLPWNPDDMNWDIEPIQIPDPKHKGRTIPDPSVLKVIAEVKKVLSGCDEIVIGTDVDPTGEGGMIAVNAIRQLHLQPATFSRMYFTDESPASIQKAFTSRKQIASLDDFDEYKKAYYRSQFDLLSMQWTRVASAMARESGTNAMLRQGRLKSAMVLLVGDQLKAYNDYVKKPFFQNRFRDENGVVYTNPDEPRFDDKAQVPAQYSASAVVEDSRADKATAPPKLLDLAGLSSLLVAKKIKAKDVLQTYQKMYEDQVVSYPRTEDKTITHEQFKELLPLVNEIAEVVDVDVTLLTHVTPRSTHVKDTGAHGANRPGPKVPDSLKSLATRYGAAAPHIYEALAKNYLAMLADDYRYEQQKGHVEKYPAFTGIANVPTSMGWKLVFDPDAGDDGDTDADQNAKGLGTQADPFVFEGANKRPEHPSMKWLMKQLEKRDVGTGATRTSTYSDVTSSTTKYPLLAEKGRKLVLADYGDMSWRLLPGTTIGDLGLTEQIYADMRDIAAGTADGAQLLTKVAGWVRDDIEVMRANAATMRADLGLNKVVFKPRAEGTWATTGAPVRFTRSWGGHEFTDDEVAQLLAGRSIEFAATGKDGKTYQVKGALGEGEYQGRTYVGFQRERPDKPTVWCGHKFTDGEIARLMSGEEIFIEGFVSAKTGNTFDCAVHWDTAARKIEPNFDNKGGKPPRAWCKHRFTDDELAKLAAGETIFVKGLTSKKGSTFDAKLTWTEEKGEKRIVPSFG